TPWLLAIGEDCRYPTTEGAKPPLATRVLRPYLDPLLVTPAEKHSAKRAHPATGHTRPAPIFGSAAGDSCRKARCTPGVPAGRASRQTAHHAAAHQHPRASAVSDRAA